MKLSKLSSVAFTTSALTIYLFGVMDVGVFAQTSATVVESDSVVLTNEDLSLVQMETKSGFGLVARRWLADLQDRYSSDPEVVVDNAEKELSLLVEEAETGEEFNAERLELARRRYEEKLARVEELMSSLDETQREVLLARIAKHEAVLNRLFVFDADEMATASVSVVLTNLEQWKERALERFEEKEERVRERLENRQEAIQEKLEEREGKLEELSQEAEAKVEARKKRLEELRERVESGTKARLEEAKVKKVDEDGNSEENLEKVNQERIEKQALEQKAAEEKYRQRVEEKQKQIEKEQKIREKKQSQNYQEVKGVSDTRPNGLLEMIGWWLGGK